ncbi:hypothetical protein IKQ26_09805 [bacterium]|nr:hypothetical protein [bacterium]
MCSTPKVTTITTSSEVIKNAVQANANATKGSKDIRRNLGGIVSENTRTSALGLTDEPSSEKKKLLGE